MSNRKAIPKERPVDSRSVDWMSGYSEGQARRACSYGLPGVRKPDERNWLAGWLRGTAVDPVPSASAVVDLNSATANMYGCEPCPRCKSQYRCVFQMTNHRIDCDDCGYLEIIADLRRIL